MADGSKGTAESIASLGSAIAAPAKVAFVAYVIVTATGRIETSACTFLLVAVVFLALQVFHDDYLRIRLNERAWLQADQARRSDGFEPRHSKSVTPQSTTPAPTARSPSDKP